jgi:hypothetical protein
MLILSLLLIIRILSQLSTDLLSPSRMLRGLFFWTQKSKCWMPGSCLLMRKSDLDSS